MSKSRSRVRENEGREKAFRAAAMANVEGISNSEAAKRCGSERTITGDARFVLQHGTVAEIASVMNDEVGIRTMMLTIRERVPAEERKRKSVGPVKSKEQIATIALQSAIWVRLRDVLDGISSLPQPSDVVGIMRMNHMRSGKINTKLPNASAWMKEFCDAWSQ